MEGTSFTSGAETVIQPTDMDKLRVYNAVVDILNSANSGGSTGIGMRIRSSASSNSDTVDLGSDMALSNAAETNTEGIKRETLDGKQYYTREYILISSSIPPSGTITVQLNDGPAGTVLANMFNVTSTVVGVALTASGSEFSGTFKICVPVDAAEAETGGSVSVQAAAEVDSCTFYRVENTHAYEQDFIIAEPASVSASAFGYL